MNYQLSPDECLQSLRDSIRSAENRFADEIPVFATEAQCTAINIAISEIFPGIARLDRINTLRLIFGRKEGCFNSSKDMTLIGASALIERLYGGQHPGKDIPRQTDAVTGIRRAYCLATGQQEIFEEKPNE